MPSDCGIVVEPGQVRELQEALIDLARSPSRRQAMGDAGRAHVVRTHTQERCAQAYLDLYDDVRTTQRSG